MDDDYRLIDIPSFSLLAFLTWHAVSPVYERDESAENQDCAGI